MKKVLNAFVIIGVIAAIVASWTAAVLTIIHAHKVWGFTISDWGGILLVVGISLMIFARLNRPDQ